MKQLPLSVRETPPTNTPGWTKVPCATNIHGMADGIHTGGPWLSPSGLHVWKACDARPFANAEGHYPTTESEALEALAGKPGFPRNWEKMASVNDDLGLERMWIVRKVTYVLGLEWPQDTIRLEQVLAVEKAIRSMNEAWWELGDHISVALDPDTYEPFILDLSCATYRPGGVGCYKPDEWWRLSAWLKWLGFDRLQKLRVDGRHVVRHGMLRTTDVPETHVHVYASRNRPMSPVWASIPDAWYEDADYNDTGVWTWICTPGPLAQDKIYSYELTWAWSPLEMEDLGK